jgi:hypothetical protein
MSFGAGFNQGSAAVARGLAGRAQQERAQARRVREQEQALLKVGLDPNNDLDIAKLQPLLAPDVPKERVVAFSELFRAAEAARQKRESGEAGAAAFAPLITDPRTGLPGPAAASSSFRPSSAFR